MDMNDQGERLAKRQEQVNELEKEMIREEDALKNRESAKKQILLRLAPALWDKVALWAQDDFRSINSQIEYLLSEAVKNRYKSE